ncbi:MAG: GtrA family protein [Bacteroides sp.]|nr:GtrA family protein [Bacteroides sp.]
MGTRLTGKGNGAKRHSHSIWVFCKAQLSAQFASVVDFLVTILLAKAFGIFYLYATFTGSVVGGMVNCAINYGWVFHAKNVKKKYVAIKYLLVWGGSLLFNTWGTFALTEWITDMTWINKLPGFYVTNVFLLCKIVVAVLVAFIWNYQMQRLFVYRNHNFRLFLKHHNRKLIK